MLSVGTIVGGKKDVPDEWIVGVVTEFYRREEHIYITDRNYRLYVHLWCDFFLDSCVDPSSETYFTANKEEMNTGKSKKKWVCENRESCRTFLFLYTLVDYKL